ncbi:MAG TPA: hypothetical protein VF247_04470 [Candidatus Krumholzibacteria bacterium]
MDTTYVTLSPEERQLLMRVLESALKSRLIEGHRTRQPGYRAGVVHEEELISRMLGKLKEN